MCPPPSALGKDAFHRGHVATAAIDIATRVRSGRRSPLILWSSPNEPPRHLAADAVLAFFGTRHADVVCMEQNGPPCENASCAAPMLALWPRLR